jgi:ribosomal-protein-alanine N-acetyltransferase
MQPEPRGYHRWVLVKKDNGARIGTCGFHCWDLESRSCDIGYDLHPDFWGKGYMGEALIEILGFAVNDMNVRTVDACIYEENEKSYMLAEKLGFLFRGKIKNEVFRGVNYPHMIFTYSV